MQNSMVIFFFPVLDQKYRFLGKFVQKIKIVGLSWNLVLLLIICKIQWWCSLFPFSTENTFFYLGEICLKKMKIVCWISNLEARRMGIAANSSVLTYLSFAIEDLKNSRCANLLANRKSYLLFIVSQSKLDM